MPRLVRLYIQSALIGFAISAAFEAVLVWQDVMGLGGLILGSDAGWIAALMLFVMGGSLFAGVQFGLRVMMLAGEDGGPKGGRRQHVATPPAMTPASAPRREGRGRRH